MQMKTHVVLENQTILLSYSRAAEQKHYKCPSMHAAMYGMMPFSGASTLTAAR
jgi:hypothetical protein